MEALRRSVEKNREAKSSSDSPAKKKSGSKSSKASKGA